MDQVQHQQQTMSQQHHQQQQMSQQQQRQQVTSSSEMRTVKQTYYVQQHQTQEQNYQMHGHQVDGFQQQGLQYQHPQQQQQNVQYQMTQQTSSTAFQGSPQIPAPASNDQIPRQNAAPVFQNAAPAPPQARPAPAPAPAPAPVQNGSPSQYANQNGTDPQHAPAPEGDLSQPDKILPQYQAPPGYCTSYVAVHGEWPPKVDNAPNMTTTYPSGFKLREKAPVEHQPARVVTSQPAFKMTQPIRKGGDSKWPPKGGMEPTQQEVREFIKPRKSNKDYSEFFAKNALPQNYAIYRPPPGTQHHGVEGEEEEGVSNM